ncbi:MAG TPA: PASTA domain-containing protein [Acidimicrobiales bacterium]|nr:PASTA domain-containing protein [Acidimicrobiales bacterium]
MATSRIADSVGRVLGDRYRLTRPLGSGASANVYAAEDVRLRRRVAVKVLHPALAGEEAFLRRFHREAQAVASLRHPNILRVYDWGDDGGAPYLVMELLEGGTLRSMLDRGALLSPAQAAAVGAGAARALDYAHRQGLVHRDIKPANLIFDDEGHVCVADFGLARALAEAAWTEPNGAVVGTARYASPELVRGENLDAKADVYSLALVLIEAMTGRVPFASDTAFGSLMARVGRPLEVPEEVGPLAPALAAAGEADPAERLDAATLARRLEEVGARLPFPAPLSLASPIHGGSFERDDISPTELPGRPRLFDREAHEAPLPAPAPAIPTAVHAPGRQPVPAADDAIDLRAGPVATGDGVAVGDQGPPPRRRRWRLIAALIAAIVILAGGGVAAWALMTGQLKPEEPVPALVGLNQAQATAAVGRVHLDLRVTGQVYSSKPSGQIVSQDPATGKLREGKAVAVVLSKGPAPVPVPNLAGFSLKDAEKALDALGLKYTVTKATSETVTAQDVISNSPNSGTLIPGQTVTIVESTGKPTVAVPAITLNSESATDATAALKAAGFTVTATQAWSNTVPAGHVISVSPPSGTQATQGSAVTLTVSKGPHYVPVPATRGDSVGTADQVLTAAGFNVTGVRGSPIGTVKGTDPAAGTQAIYGSSIVIITN